MHFNPKNPVAIQMDQIFRCVCRSGWDGDGLTCAIQRACLGSHVLNL